MKRLIKSNSQVGTYKGIVYGIEDSGDQRYYFIDKYGKTHYADTEEELFSDIDSIVASTRPSHKRAINSMSLVDVMQSPRGRKLVKRIEDIEQELYERDMEFDDESEPLARMRKSAVNQLKDDFDCVWASSLTRRSKMKRHSRIMSSSNIDADLYVVRFLVEIDPGHDVPYPQVAEDFIEVYATSPQEAKEYALRQWGNQPYERMDIVDINPDDDYDGLPPFNSSSICSSTEYDYDEYVDYDDIYDEAEYEDGFMDIENEVAAELGVYLDFSGCRYHSGTIFIFSDPNNECNSDMWDGDWNALLKEIDFSEYIGDVVSSVLLEDKSEWKDRYKAYLSTLI